MQTICVYCASSTQLKPQFFDAAERLAKIFVEAGLAVVFGGGCSGLMGKLADTMMAENGKITGIIPQFMIDEEWHHPNLSELIVVETMHERKALMATYLEKAERLRKKVKTAMMYPSAVTIVAISITVFLLVKVVPTFKDIYSGFGAQLPGPTLFLMDLSEIIKKYQPVNKIFHHLP